ncbi:hepatic lectin-like [Saccoglossus kowalevskii]
MIQDVKDIVANNQWTKQNCHNGGFWIGLHDPDTTNAIPHTEADLQWVSNDPCVKYFEWEPFQPDDNTKQNVAGQACVCLWSKKNGLMDDNYCILERGYICEKFIHNDCGDSCGCDGGCPS